MTLPWICFSMASFQRISRGSSQHLSIHISTGKRPGFDLIRLSVRRFSGMLADDPARSLRFAFSVVTATMGLAITREFFQASCLAD